MELYVCSRCSRSMSGVHDPSVTCAKGHIQCKECDKAMRHKCRRCGILTTLSKQRNIRSVDPRTLSPEELTQLELNAALNQFKLNFLKKSKKKKRQRLIESTSRIIEILNPSLIEAYRQCGRINQKEIEDHFFRTSDKTEHSFQWHKAALEFMIERVINLNVYDEFQYDDSIIKDIPEVKSTLDLQNKIKMELPINGNCLDYLGRYSVYDENGQLYNMPKSLISLKDSQISIQEQQQQQDVVQEDENYNQKTSNPELLKDTKLVFVKPPIWLTEISCPHCRLFLRLSDFSKHFATYHCLPIECIDIDERKRILLDPKILVNRTSCPHTLFLIKNIIRDLGGSEYRNFYPIVLVTTAFRKSDFNNKNNNNNNNNNNNKNNNPTKALKYERKNLMIWLSGIYLSDHIQVHLKIISQKLDDLKQCTKLNRIYPITRSQCLKDIYNTRAKLIITSEMLREITKNGIDNIILEISINGKNTSNV